MVRFSVFFICSYGGLHIENGDKGGGFGPVGVSCTAGGQNWDMVEIPDECGKPAINPLFTRNVWYCIV